MSRPGTRVYLRPEVLVIERSTEGSSAPLAPDAEAAIEALAEGGWTVTVLGDDPGPAAARLDHAGAAPEHEPGAWLVTADVTDCRWARRAGLRSVLVGGAIESGPARCDHTSRNLFAAALEILSSEQGVPSVRE
jgi:hypothetical protein